MSWAPYSHRPSFQPYPQSKGGWAPQPKGWKGGGGGPPPPPPPPSGPVKIAAGHHGGHHPGHHGYGVQHAGGPGGPPGGGRGVPTPGAYTRDWPLGDILMRTRHRRFVAPDVTRVTREEKVTLPTTKSRMLFDVTEGGSNTVGAGPTLPDSPLTVRVLFVRVGGSAGDYLPNRIHVLAQREAHGGGMRLYGGAWSKEDGDPTDPATARNTALRVLKDNCGVSNKELIFAPLLEVSYLREAGKKTRTVVLLAVAEGESGRAVRIAPSKVVDEAGQTIRIPAEYNMSQMRRTTALPSDETFEMTIAVDMLWDSYEELMAGRIAACLKNARVASEEAKKRAQEKEAFAKARREAQETFLATLTDLSADDAAAQKATFEGEWDKRNEELLEKLGIKEEEKKEFDQALADSFAFLENPALAATHCTHEEKLKNVLTAARAAPTMQGIDEVIGVLSAHRQQGILSYAHVLQVAPESLLPQEKEFEVEPEPEPEPESAADPAAEQATPMEEDVPAAAPAEIPAAAPAEIPSPEPAAVPEAAPETPQPPPAPPAEEGTPMAVDKPEEAASPSGLKKSDLEGMSHRELQALCKARGLKAVGKATDLRERLFSAPAAE
eukprot:Hpha_TRINITY_DN16303_c2_g17::TRINITY_DN16303_c2_g17_i1::g.61836::m.61836